MNRLLIIGLLIDAASVFGQSIASQATDVAPLLIGEKIPEVTLRTVDDKPVDLLGLVGQKPSVIIFYRGGWCPYCNLHLAELQTIEAAIHAAGYQILAISPDSPESLQASVSKAKLGYTLLSDSDAKAAQGFGLAFQMPEKYTEMLGKASGGKNTGVLPVPAVFVVNTRGEIEFEYVNPDYKKRLKGNLLMAVLRELK